MKLPAEAVEAIAQILRAVNQTNGTETVLSIGAADGRTPSIVLTLAVLPSERVVLSAQTVHGYFELHDVTRYVLVEPDEVIFVAEEGERISGLVVGASGACSLFANVHRGTLTADLGSLEPALLLAAMQLGLAENIST